MRKINARDLEPIRWSSPKGTFAGSGVQLSEGLGRDRNSTDLNHRHPFDVEILRVPPGKTPYPYHAHSAQWEFYHVIAGSGIVRDDGGKTRVGAGDAFVFRPGEAHQLFNDGSDDLVIYVVADNPYGEAAYYPDSKKWSVPLPERRLLRSEPLDYFDGEE
ncbi:MAG TPA: cupin domain-containing protein [Candidatus Acidoferrales bacterium]|nr:cupin domain-containing protein [Candidatus Acidoferrales bacterium]